MSTKTKKPVDTDRERRARKKAAADKKLGTTPTPWRVVDYAGWDHRKGFMGEIRGPGECDAMDEEGRKKICVFRGPASFESMTKREDAVRIVACVNACEGVSNGSLAKLKPGLLAKLVATALAINEP